MIPALLTTLAMGATPPVVLVLDLDAKGVPPAAAQAATRTVVRVLGERADLAVVGKEEADGRFDLEQTQALLGCDADASCVAEIANPADAKLVVAGSLGKIDERYLLSLTLIDTDLADARARAGGTFEAGGDLEKALEESVREALGSMFGWASASERPKFSLPKGKESSFVVLDFAAAGIAPDTASNLTDVLAAELKRIDGVRVINKSDVIAMVGADRMKQLFAEDCEDACLVELAGALDTDYLVIGRVGRLSDTYLVSMTLVDQRSRDVGASYRISESFRGQEDQLIRAVRFAGRKLLDVSTEAAGEIAVSGPVQEASVFVDGAKLGELPLAPRSGFEGGRYSVRLAKEGYLDWQSDVYVDPGETTLVWATLKPVPEAWYEKWWVWTAVGVAVAGGVTTAIVVGRQTPENGSGTVAFE